jgi:Cys-rich repeat protein
MPRLESLPDPDALPEAPTIDSGSDLDAATAPDSGGPPECVTDSDCASGETCTSARRCVLTLAASQDTPYGLAVNGSDVYWTNCADRGAVMTIPRDGGAPRALVTDRWRPTELIADPSNVYWLEFDPGSVMKVARAGGAPVVLAAAPFPRALAVDDTHVYFTSGSDEPGSGSVWKVPREGGSPAMLAAGLTMPRGIVVHAGDVYWSSMGPDGALMRIAAGGGVPTRLGTHGTLTGGIAVNATTIFFTGIYSNAVAKMPLNGGPVVGVGFAKAVYQVVVDGPDVYWPKRHRCVGSGCASTPPCCWETVWTAPTVGGSAAAVASEQGSPWNVAVDDRSVYWTDAMRGMVLRAPR